MRRRRVLQLAALALLTGCAPGGTTAGLRIAAGERGGFYVEFAQLLAERLGAVVVETSGSVDNLDLLDGGAADLALTLADVAAAERRPLAALGRVYENYMQLVVLDDSPITAVAGIGGRRVSLGAQRSGAAVFGERLLAAAGITARVEHHGLTEAVERLDAGAVDALLWSGGVPTPALTALAGRHPIRLIDLTGALPALRAAHGPAYQSVVVPAGSYAASPPVATIGVSNLLVARPGLPDEVAAAVATTLVREAPRLIPPSALGTQYLDLRSLIETGDVPLHPGAAEAYRALRR
ncbi:TAXI family TRAP transporter solute-binding subunit [Actinokineospora bangkokensis]|uniref:C4-dicarboxylate ABC transporter substrate-binding protein n=1 Tax=Actinokineospora bangkokensis TaxID=1193682 RepID=A0A1Q9LLL0_9PSEU|nr:TAXI family TRAP transporter solute-binding subunit [Actinokineospora bangkokensis]OLR92884.1 C4-dicarboxylate ABC transporter substrate-binding protein [Actinokineospora bangkokensis]